MPRALSQTSVEFLERYNYQVITRMEYVIISNKDVYPKVFNVLLIITGLAGIPVWLAGSYKLGLLMLLLITIPIIRIKNQSPKRIKIDFNKKQINSIGFANIERFDYSQSDAFAHATPFEEGTTEYTLHLEAITKHGRHIPLMQFVDRKENKPDAEAFLKELNTLLEEAL